MKKKGISKRYGKFQFKGKSGKKYYAKTPYNPMDDPWD